MRMLGGSGGAGGTPSTGGSSGGAPIGDAGVGFDLSYAGFGQWVGYTSATADDSSVIEHARMCAAGVVTLDPERLACASWNWNVNQAFDGEPEAWIPTSEFIDYDIETSGELLQLVLLDDQDNSGCLPLPGTRRTRPRRAAERGRRPGLDRASGLGSAERGSRARRRARVWRSRCWRGRRACRR